MHIFKIITASERTDEKIEVNRWTVKGELGAQIWRDLITRLQRLFNNTRSTQFYVSWYDGTDYCTISEWQDLEEAIIFQEESDGAATGHAVRLFASMDKREHQTVFGERPESDDEIVDEAEVKVKPIITPPIAPVKQESSEAQVKSQISVEPKSVVASTPSELAVKLENTKLENTLPKTENKSGSDSLQPIAPMPMPMHAWSVNQKGVGIYPYPPAILMPYSPRQSSMPATPATPLVSQMSKPTPIIPPTETVESKESPQMGYMQARYPMNKSELWNEEGLLLVGDPVPEKKESRRKMHIKFRSRISRVSRVDKPEKSVSKKAWVNTVFDSLRDMGYMQDSEYLKRLIKEKNGDIEEITNILNSQI